MKRPQFEEWDDANHFLYRKFELVSYEIEIIRNAVDAYYSGARGNRKVTHQNISNILKSIQYRQITKENMMRKHPRTWVFRFNVHLLKRWFHRTFKTKHFKNQVWLSNESRRLLDELH